ncbi:cysteine desulfurase family protein [Schleiferia thermophila]|uniref:cysteine desulfurase family protein n=1 Tax=Schleiferia thermophila TaxID=884107 RepID=UPI00068A5DC5|nr:cysteine desulfurase family protein [Schleiferia thermophila]
MIYLDYASTTPLCPIAREAISEAFEVWGNPSSLHTVGRKAKAFLELSRRKLSEALGVLPAELYFTSGATEATNWALWIAARSGIKRIITSPIEHKATLEPLNQLVEVFNISISWLNVLADGQYDLEHLDKLLSDSKDPTMVSSIWVHNELGNIQPIKEISTLCRRYKALLHVDAVQAIAKIPVDLHLADLASVSAHKFYGPKGVGSLFIHKNISHKWPLIAGGSQERSIRGGTEPTLLIPGMSAALHHTLARREDHYKQLINLKRLLFERLSDIKVEFNGAASSDENHFPGIVNISLPDEDDTGRLLFELDLAGIAVSAGSACNSGSLKPSHVISYLYPQRVKYANLRISMGYETTSNEIIEFCQILKKCLPKSSLTSSHQHG